MSLNVLAYAKVLEHAIDVFGTQRLAEEWLGRPCKYQDASLSALAPVSCGTSLEASRRDEADPRAATHARQEEHGSRSAHESYGDCPRRIIFAHTVVPRDD